MKKIINSRIWDVLYYLVMIPGALLLIINLFALLLGSWVNFSNLFLVNSLFEINLLLIYWLILPLTGILVVKYFITIFTYHYRGEFLFNIIVLSGLAIALNYMLVTSIMFLSTLIQYILIMFQHLHGHSSSVITYQILLVYLYLILT